MALETHPAFNGESKTPHAGGGFETSKETKRRRRRERRPERERSHERTHVPLEPLTIWVRTDPNRLQHPEDDRKEKQEKQKDQAREIQKQKSEAKKEEKKQPSKPVETADEATVPQKEQELRKESPANTLAPDPRTEGVIPTPAAPKPEQPKPEAAPQAAEEMPVFQELPRLDIRPRHFYTEPEVRQPNATETEHDILPAAKAEESKETSPKQPVAEQQPAPQPAPRSEGLPQTGAQLQELAERNAKRAAELYEKNQEAPELPAPQRAPQPAEQNEHVRAITGGHETEIRMDPRELLEVADSIRVEGVSLADMFHAERIDEEGLRRIIGEFLKGQRIEKTISEEVLRQQMRFERDPQMRKVPVSAMQDAPTRSQASAEGRQRKTFNKQNMRRQADRIADRLAGGIDRVVENAENNPNIFKTVGGVLAVVVYFVILILIIRS